MIALSIYIKHWLIESNHQSRLNYRIKLADDIHKNFECYARFYENDETELVRTLKNLPILDKDFKLYRRIIHDILWILPCPEWVCDGIYNFPYNKSSSMKHHRRCLRPNVFPSIFYLSRRHFKARAYDSHQCIFPIPYYYKNTDTYETYNRILPYI